MHKQNDCINSIKHSGQVFTPNNIVKLILDYSEYFGPSILNKHIIDNSCGDGAFLIEIITRYCEEALKSGRQRNEIKKGLETYIHGIEIDTNTYNTLLYNLNATASTYGIYDISWDMHNNDALLLKKYDHKMDYVVGNPPYVRVHNLTDYSSVKSFCFADKGMTDLYLAFYEIGLTMLKDNGKLCYITPSSWLSSIAGQNFRHHLLKTKKLVGIIDFEHQQVFSATTYSVIVLLQNNHNSTMLDYFNYDIRSNNKIYICSLCLNEIVINGKFYLCTPETLTKLHDIKAHQSKQYVQVKNGFATLADKVFFGDVPNSSITIPVLKASTGKWYKGLFPYTKDGIPIPIQTILSEDSLESYYSKNKAILLKRSSPQEEWIYYGRSQAIKDINKMKYSVNTIINDISSLKINVVPPGSGIYSGLYIIGNISKEKLLNLLLTEEFINYVRALKNYKSGGYYTFNSKDLEEYLNYKLDHNENI